MKYLTALVLALFLGSSVNVMAADAAKTDKPAAEKPAKKEKADHKHKKAEKTDAKAAPATK